MQAWAREFAGAAVHSRAYLDSGLAAGRIGQLECRHLQEFVDAGRTVVASVDQEAFEGRTRAVAEAAFPRMDQDSLGIGAFVAEACQKNSRLAAA